MSDMTSGFAPHDHDQCKSTAMAAAEAHCAKVGAQFTPVRRRTLEILLESHEAMGAYDVLARLEKDGFGAKPPVAYRALGFLVDHGLAHRIERLNAFIACTHPSDGHQPAFMICRSCGHVEETAQEPMLQGVTQSVGFVAEHAILEIEGLCPSCAET